jgi:ubiquinone/menaquinone biosynthesis C-methylase UbiE
MMPKLQLGAGTNVLSGWFNTDYFARPTVFFLDVTKKFPFTDNLFELIFSEHHIEHISYKDAQNMLAESFRVMKQGGYIKIITPNLQQYIHCYANDEVYTPIIKQHTEDWVYSGFDKAINYIPVDDHYKAHFINDIFLNYEHKFIYDAQALKTLIKKAGFININVIGLPSVSHRDFEGIETHRSKFDLIFNLTIEAQKPLN